MSAPLVTPDDLRVYLELDTINIPRASLILRLAQGLCEGVATPLPAGAAAVVLDVAKRGFVNPDGAQEVAIGSARVQYANQQSTAPSGLYLSDTNKANIRLLTGTGGAFSIDLLPKGVNAVQTLSFTGTVTSGTFTLALGSLDQVTDPIDWNASAWDVHDALSALPAVGVGNVAVSGVAGSALTITFVNDRAAMPMPLLIANGSSLTGTDPGVTVAITTVGRAGYSVGYGLTRNC